MILQMVSFCGSGDTAQQACNIATQRANGTLAALEVTRERIVAQSVNYQTTSYPELARHECAITFMLETDVPFTQTYLAELQGKGIDILQQSNQTDQEPPDYDTSDADEDAYLQEQDNPERWNVQ